MTGLTMTDCSVADNVTQAKYELDRAMAASGYTQCAQWAMKWGRALLEVAAEHAGEDYVSREEHCDSMDRVEGDVEALQNEIADIHEKVREAINTLEAAL